MIRNPESRNREPGEPVDRPDGRGSETEAVAEGAPARVAAIAQALDRWYDAIGRQFGPLSRPQRRMLRLLSGERRVRVTELAESLGLTTAGATRMLDTLESLGYARRYRAAGVDQRQVHVALTAEGERALREADQAFLERVSAHVERLDARDQATLARLLARLLEPAAHG